MGDIGVVTDAGWSEEDMSLERRGGEGLPGTDTVLASITYFIRTLGRVWGWS